LPQTIEVVVRLTLTEEDLEVNRLEERVRAARDAAGRTLRVRALEVLDELALGNHPGAGRQRRVERGLDTILGHIRFRRWRVKAQGKTTCLLDRLLGLERHRRASPAVKKRASELASRMTYREAAQVLREEVRTPISAESVHGWVQALGRAVEERELVGPSTAPARRDVVVVEWDDTPLRTQDKDRQPVVVKLGIGYSRKRRAGPKRWVLADKLVYGGVEAPEDFAERFWVRMEGSFQVTEARHVVVKGDGAEWIR